MGVSQARGDGTQSGGVDPDSVKLIACDVDDTVAIAGEVVSPELHGIFAALGRRGIAATLATGRTLHHTKPIADALGLGGYLICSEGGCVVSTDGADYLHHPHMGAETIGRIAQVVSEADGALEFGVLSRDRIYVCTDAGEHYVRPWGTRLTTIQHWANAPDPVLLLIFGPGQVVDALAARLEETLPADMLVILETHRTRHHQIKVCSAQVDKAVAARTLAEHMGIGLENVLMFGDWLNDLGLMRAAGYSIAPSTGAPAAQAAASKVSAYSCEEGFVARELEAMFGPFG